MPERAYSVFGFMTYQVAFVIVFSMLMWRTMPVDSHRREVGRFGNARGSAANERGALKTAGAGLIFFPPGR